MPCKPYPMQRRMVRRATHLLDALRYRRLHCASKTTTAATQGSDRCSPNDKTRLIDPVCTNSGGNLFEKRLSPAPLFQKLLSASQLSGKDIRIKPLNADTFSGIFYMLSPQSAFLAALNCFDDFVTRISEIPSAVQTCRSTNPPDICG